MRGRGGLRWGEIGCGGRDGWRRRDRNAGAVTELRTLRAGAARGAGLAVYFQGM